jgi:hypothetical protein
MRSALLLLQLRQVERAEADAVDWHLHKYSNSALPRLISVAIYHGDWVKFLKCPYQEKVMNTLEAISSSMVSSSR